MAIYALINKEVIPFVCAGKKVSVEFLHERTNFQIDKLNQWLDVTDASLPTILQAKKLAKCLHIPFAGLYMNTGDINIRKLYRQLETTGRLMDAPLLMIAVLISQFAMFCRNGISFSKRVQN